jgi:hypothetical protein
MRLREIFENIYEEVPKGDVHDGGLKTIGVCFGRFNPPHKGHKAVWQSAASNPIWYVGTNETTSGPKDPLPYDVKLQCMAAVWPKVAGHVIPEQSLLTLASKIYEEHGENVHLKVYTDEEWLYKTLAQYNGVQGKQHGGYKFTQIDWAKTERLASATNLRAAVRAGDKKSFYHDMGVRPSVTIDIDGNPTPIFDVVAHYLNQYPEKVKKEVAEGGGTQKIHHHHKAAIKNATTFPSMNQSTGSAYMGYRMGIALAGAPNYPTKIEADNWIGGDPLLSPYTDEENEMINAAAKQVGGGKRQTWSNNRSLETADVNKTSAVPKIKKNKYGI